MHTLDETVRKLAGHVGSAPLAHLKPIEAPSSERQLRRYHIHLNWLHVFKICNRTEGDVWTDRYSWVGHRRLTELQCSAPQKGGYDALVRRTVLVRRRTSWGNGSWLINWLINWLCCNRLPIRYLASFLGVKDLARRIILQPEESFSELFKCRIDVHAI